MERHRSRANGGEEPARFTRGEDEKCARRGLLQELQECISSFLTRLLGNESLGVSDHEYLPQSHGRAALRMGPQSLGHGKVESCGFSRCRSGPKRAFPVLRQRIVASFLEGVRKLSGPHAPRFREREIPVEVGMFEIDGHPAPLAVTARAFRPGLGAKQKLAEPESESLFSYASWAMDEQARRKRLGCKGP